MPLLRFCTYIMMNLTYYKEMEDVFMYPYNPYDPYNQYGYQPQYDLQAQYQQYIDQTEQVNPYDQNRQFQLPISFLVLETVN